MEHTWAWRGKVWRIVPGLFFLNRISFGLDFNKLIINYSNFRSLFMTRRPSSSFFFCSPLPNCVRSTLLLLSFFPPPPTLTVTRVVWGRAWAMCFCFAKEIKVALCDLLIPLCQKVRTFSCVLTKYRVKERYYGPQVAIWWRRFRFKAMWAFLHWYDWTELYLTEGNMVNPHIGLTNWKRTVYGNEEITTIGSTWLWSVSQLFDILFWSMIAQACTLRLLSGFRQDDPLSIVNK